MNSEINNVLKLSSVTVAKASDKQTQERSPFDMQKEVAANMPNSSAAQHNLQVDSSNSNGVSDESKSNDRATPPNPDVIKKAVEEGNSLLQATKRNLQFKVDDETEELVVKVVDSESGELVRQIPSEEMLAFVRRMQELDGQQGSVLQDRA